MSSLNKTELIGRLGRDPEVRFTNSGQAVANFTLATDETYKDRDGNKQKKTEWHNIVVWGKVAEEYVGKYLKKGMLIYVEGKLQTRSWDKDGVKQYKTEVNANNIIGLESKPSQNGSAPAARPAASRPAQTSRPAAGQYRAPAPQTYQEPDNGPISDEDVPF